MIMAGPDVLGLPASTATVARIAFLANTCVLTTSATLAGLVIISLVARIPATMPGFVTDMTRSLRSFYTLLGTALLASLFVAMLAAYLGVGFEPTSAGSSWLVNADLVMPQLTIARIAFFLTAALAAGGMVLALAGYFQGTNERAIVFGLRVVCGAGALGGCMRLIELWVTYAHHPSIYIPGLAITIAVGILLTISVTGSALLGILRPRNPLWLIVTTALVIAGFAASSSIDLKLANAARLVTSPTFDAAVRPQPTMMVLFFVCCGFAAGVLALMARWWCTDSIPDARYPMPEKTS